MRGGGAGLTHPPWPQRGGGEREVMLSLGSRTAVLAVEKNSEKSGRCPCAAAPTVPSFLVSFSTPRCPSTQVRRGSHGWRGRLRGNPDGMRGMTFKAAQARTCLVAPIQGCTGSDDGPTSGSRVLTRLPTHRAFLQVERVSLEVVQ